MKKLFCFLLTLLSCSLMSYAQNYGKYSLPHTNSAAELQQFVGQRVKVMKYNGYLSIYGKEDHDEYIFSGKFYGVIDRIYTISKVKVGSQIMLELVDNGGGKIKAKINANGEHNYKGMQSCKSFFLVDKFEEDKASLIGKKFTNSNGEEVAEVIDCEFKSEENSYPKLQYLVKSKLDGSAHWFSSLAKAEKLCKRFGEVLKDSRVKTTYQVVGLNELKSIFNKYNVRNLETNEVKVVYESDDLARSAFAEDLSGHYIATLTNVEKPANAAIRYGKTTVVSDEKNVSKFSYVDNVIDILIFGTSEQFSFVLKNVSDNSIKVVWNEAMFVDFDGSTSKIMHSGIKYSQKEGDQPATTIIKGAKIDDLACPISNVRYSDSSKKWVTDSMYPAEAGKSPGQLKLMLPIQIKEVINEYVFVFDVTYVYNHPERLTF